MTDLIDLAEMEHEDMEYVPEIVPVDARLSLRGPVAKLIELFERSANVTPAKEIIPGTGFALLEAFTATSDTVSYARLTATDGDLTVSVIADSLNVTMEGSVLLPGKKVLDILKLAPTTMVRLEVLGNTATIRSGRALWTVQTPIGDYITPPPNVDAITMFEVRKEPFLHALTVARRAVAGTASRPALMQASLRKGSITASDGGRVHRQSIEEFPKELDFSLPVKVMDEAARMLRSSDDVDEYFEIGASAQHIVFRLGANTLIAQSLLVPFPDVETLLLAPAFSNEFSLTVDRADFIEVLKRVRVNADPDYSSVFLALVPGKKDSTGLPTWTMAVKAKDTIGNTSQEVLDVQWIGGGKVQELCLNHRYLMDLLQSYTEELLVFKVGVDTKTRRSPLFLEDKKVGFTAIVTQMHPNYLK